MRLHFIAISDIVMCDLALALYKNGHTISGSDEKINKTSENKLRDLELLPENNGWFPEKITSNLDAVILGVNVKRDNPELLKAEELGIKIYSYPEFIYEQNSHKTRVVISGSYGKTTITSMILHVLNYHCKEVDYVTKVPFNKSKDTVRLSDNAEFIVLEGDEYISSNLDARPKFLHYKPTVALLSGIDWNYTNIYPTEETYNEQFKVFIDSITNGGILMYNEEDKVLEAMVQASENPIRKMPYCTPEYIVDAGETYLITPDGEMPLEIFGKHNLNNLEGAKWICQHMGIDEEDFYEAIAEFKGVPNRLEKVNESDNLVIFKDNANTPSKVSSSFYAIKEVYPTKKIIACIELYTYSNLDTHFMKRYQNILNTTDECIIFMNSENLEKRGITPPTDSEIENSFKNSLLLIFRSDDDLQNYLYQKNWDNHLLLLMVSEDFKDLDINKIQ